MAHASAVLTLTEGLLKMHDLGQYPRPTESESPFFKDFIYLLFERGKEGEREGEKHQCVVASHLPLLGTWPTTQASILIGNRTSDPVVHRPALSPLSHISQG